MCNLTWSIQCRWEELQGDIQKQMPVWGWYMPSANQVTELFQLVVFQEVHELYTTQCNVMHLQIAPDHTFVQNTLLFMSA